MSCLDRTQARGYSSMEVVCSSLGRIRMAWATHGSPRRGRCMASRRQAVLPAPATPTLLARWPRHGAGLPDAASCSLHAHSCFPPCSRAACGDMGCLHGARGAEVAPGQGGAWRAAGHSEHLAPCSSFAVTHPGNPRSSRAGCPGPLLPPCKAMREQRIITSSGCLPPCLPMPIALTLQWGQEVAPGTRWPQPWAPMSRCSSLRSSLHPAGPEAATIQHQG